MGTETPTQRAARYADALRRVTDLGDGCEAYMIGDIYDLVLEEGLTFRAALKRIDEGAPDAR